MENATTIASLTVLAALLPNVGFSAASIPVSDCEFMQSYGPDMYYEKHMDIGAGFVMYAERSDDGGSVIVANCFSGSTLTVDHSGQDSTVVQKFVLAEAGSSEKVTLAMLREHFSSLGFWTRLDVQTREHCACAAFYPNAKGKKDDWQSRYQHP